MSSSSDSTSAKLVGTLNHVSFDCQSVSASIKFYKDVLGFEDDTRRPDSLKDIAGAWLIGNGIGIHLIKTQNVPNKDPDQLINPKDNHISFQCSNMVVVEERLKTEGVKFLYQPAGLKQDDITVDQVFFHDPDGNTIEICNCQNLPDTQLPPQMACFHSVSDQDRQVIGRGPSPPRTNRQLPIWYMAQSFKGSETQ